MDARLVAEREERRSKFSLGDRVIPLTIEEYVSGDESTDLLTSPLFGSASATHSTLREANTT